MKTTINDNGFQKWFNRNLIYCETTHSFVHRLFDKIVKRSCQYGYRDAQAYAFEVLREMIKEYDKSVRGRTK